MGLNKMNVYLANRGDYGGLATTPWVGTATNNDKQRFDLARWHLYEDWVRRLRDSGVVAQLWFFADDSGFGDLPDADRERLIRYGLARLGGYANTLFTLALEWQEGWSPAEVDRHAQVFDGHDPWHRLFSVHGTTGDFKFPAASWADYMAIQAGNDADHREVHKRGLANRALAVKPLLQEEHGRGEEDTVNRQNAWGAFTAGAAGSGTGAYLRPLAIFTGLVPFERMAPADELVRTGEAYALAEGGRAYVLYLPGGGTAALDLSAAPGPLVAEWFDPRQGTFAEPAAVAGGGVVSLKAPGAGDWALYLRRAGAAPSTAGASFQLIAACRAVDTRTGLGTALGPLLSGERRRFTLAGTCGIPATARGVIGNLTAVDPTARGRASLWPGDLPRPSVSSLSFAAGSARANNFVTALGADGTVDVEPTLETAGTVHLVIDVTGYFE